MNRVEGVARFAPRRVLMALVRGYRYAISPALGNSCRFEPSCSAYALVALERHGAAAGTCLAVYRLARCGPWCAGGHDPVPAPGRGPLRRHFSFGRASDAARPPATESNTPSP